MARDDHDPAAARLQDMAYVVVHTGLTPADYWALTIAERGAIVAMINEVNKARSGR